MSWGEEQQKEIETIRERKITVKLSDADCDRLARKCGEHGLTIGELIENFVGDLVGGTYSNESDERDYADRWFERCWFGMFPEQTLLSHLLCNGYEPENYLDLLDCIKYAEYDKERAKEVPEEYYEEVQKIVKDTGIYCPEPIKRMAIITKLLNDSKTIWESGDQRLIPVQEKLTELLRILIEEIEG